jgi:crotonobetainyl-CoA:carnitine CoA-transferase CaiB-like acyl-CoA transferase
MGQEELIDDPRFCDAVSRVANRDELDDLVSKWMADHTMAEVLKVFSEHKVAIAPILSIEDIFENEQYVARGDVLRVHDDELGGDVAMPAVFPFFSRTPGVVRHAGRPLGADNDDVFTEWLAPRQRV